MNCKITHAQITRKDNSGLQIKDFTTICISGISLVTSICISVFNLYFSVFNVKVDTIDNKVVFDGVYRVAECRSILNNWGL